MGNRKTEEKNVRAGSRAQQSRVRAVVISYLRGACSVTRWDGVSNKNVYEKCGMRGCGSGVWCGVVEWVKRSTLRWFGHTERMENEEFVKVYLSSVEGPSRRGRPLGRREDRVKEYFSERGGKVKSGVGEGR